MPYGIPKSAGGDNPGNMAKMKKCVDAVMKKGKLEENAIKICKVSMFGEAVIPDTIQATIQELEALEAGINLEGVGRMLSNRNITDLKKAAAIIMDVISRQEANNQAASLIAATRPDIVFQADGGISLEAGDRFGTMLYRARRSKGLMMSQVAEKTPVSESMYMRLENGYTRNVPPPDVLDALALALGLNVDELRQAAVLDFEQPVDGGGYY